MITSLKSFDVNVRYLLEEVGEERQHLSERYAASQPIRARSSNISVEGLGCRDNRSLRNELFSFL
jgi:hypothetical protein